LSVEKEKADSKDKWNQRQSEGIHMIIHHRNHEAGGKKIASNCYLVSQQPTAGASQDKPQEKDPDATRSATGAERFLLSVLSALSALSLWPRFSCSHSAELHSIYRAKSIFVNNCSREDNTVRTRSTRAPDLHPSSPGTRHS